MKKLYFLFLSFFLFSITVNAQLIDEDFESYDTGALGSQNIGTWSVWSGNVSNAAESIIVSDAFALSGTNSGLIGAGPGPQDAMLILSNIDAGMFELTFNMYIPAGKTGYFNIQGMTSPSGGAGNGGNGVFNSSNLIFNNQPSPNGMPGLGGSYIAVTDPDPLFSWEYPEDTWFPVTILFQPEDNLWTMWINEVEIVSQEFEEDMVIGAIDFFAVDANNEYYVDDILFRQVFTSSVSNPILNSAKVYPNPVSDVLTIETSEIVDEITVYNVLGSPLVQTIPNNNSPVVDMSNFASGLYFVGIRIGNEISTIKVRK